MSDNLEQDTNNDEDVVLENSIQEQPIEKEEVKTTPFLEEKKEESSGKKQKIKQNVRTERTVFVPKNEEVDDYICVASDSTQNIQQNIFNGDRTNLEDSEEGRNWAITLKEGLEHNLYNKAFESNLEDPNSDFTNNLIHNGEKLRVKTTKITNNISSGEKAILRAAQELGIGVTKTIPLFNSGFHIILKPYSDLELVNLNVKIAENKISLGSQSKGLVYSSATYYVTECIMDFIRDHIYNTTLKLEPEDDIMDYIVSQDIHDLIWGELLTSNPSGFNYKRSCSSDPTNCRHVESGLLKLQESQYINRAALTDSQKIFMSQLGVRSKSKEDVLRYQKELVCMSNKKITLLEKDNFKVNVVFKAATIREYINSSRRWVMEMSDNVNKMFSNASESDRDNFIIEAGKATSIRQYCYYVEKIEEVISKKNKDDLDGEEENIITDRETIEKYLSFVCDEKTRNKFFEEVIDYISKSTVTVIGIPVFNCSECKQPQTQGTDTYDPVFSEIIPLDMLTYFFSHLTQKTSRTRLL